MVSKTIIKIRWLGPCCVLVRQRSLTLKVYLGGEFTYQLYKMLLDQPGIEVFKTYFGSNDVCTVHPYIHRVCRPLCGDEN